MISWRFGLSVSSSRLWNGCRSLWIGVEFGPWVWWLQRWDTDRARWAHGGGWIEPGGAMTWHVGRRGRP